MAEIFVNYRVSDEPYAAALIDQELATRFGDTRVFRASRSIRPGEDFSRELLRSVRGASVLLAVIGPRWLVPRPVGELGEAVGHRPVDWVEREIAEALEHRVRVIPVLVADTHMPAESDLPPTIRLLARCQYLRLHHRNVAYDVARLANELLDLVPALTAAGSATLGDLRPPHLKASTGGGRGPVAAALKIRRRWRAAASTPAPAVGAAPATADSGGRTPYRRVILVIATVGLLVAVAVGTYLVTDWRRPGGVSLGAAAAPSPAPATPASGAESKSRPASPPRSTPPTASAPDQIERALTTFGAKQNPCPRRVDRLDNGTGLRITAPQSGTHLDAHPIVTGWARADQAGEHLWIFLYATQACLYYILKPLPGRMRTGSWSIQIDLNTNQAGKFEIYAAVLTALDDRTLRGVQDIFEHQSVGADTSSVYQLPSTARYAHIQVTCCA